MKSVLQIVIMVLVATGMMGCATSKVAFTDPRQPGQEAVVLLHGLGRTNRSMKPMEKALVAAGYIVYSIQYPSTKKSVEQLADDHLAPLLVECQATAPGKIHFVTHSLGAIVLRQYFINHTLNNVGRIVMLGPPNQGSEVVDKLGSFTLYDWINGPAGQQLGTSSNSLPNQLPVPPVEFGVIAGNRSINWILSAMIPGPDDGKVSVDRTQSEGMVDFVTVTTAHPFLMRNRRVIALTMAFLQDGSFGAASSCPSIRGGR